MKLEGERCEAVLRPLAGRASAVLAPPAGLEPGPPPSDHLVGVVIRITIGKVAGQKLGGLERERRPLRFPVIDDGLDVLGVEDRCERRAYISG